MSVRRIQQTLIGILLLAGSVFLLSDIFGGHADTARQPVVQQPAPKYAVVQATRPLARGSVIRKEDVALRSTGEAPPRGALINLDDALERVALRSIATSDVVSDANSAAAAKGVNVSELIPPGMRAVALHVTEDSAVANLIRPGDKVDVLVVSNASKTVQAANRLFPPAEAVTLLQNIAVLAVGEMTVGGGSSGSNTKNVTLVVTPRDAAVIALVRTVGAEYLSLRAAGDDSTPVVVPVSSDAFQSRRPEPAAAPRARPPAPAPRVVEVISGTSEKISKVPVEEGK
jgi:Flp pilus assembly protein CpaB